MHDYFYSGPITLLEPLVVLVGKQHACMLLLVKIPWFVQKIRVFFFCSEILWGKIVLSFSHLSRIMASLLSTTPSANDTPVELKKFGDEINLQSPVKVSRSLGKCAGALCVLVWAFRHI